MFSFFTPAYNAGRYIAQTLSSILQQTIPDWELILVIDEASTDDTLQIAREYAQHDARIRLITVPHCNQAEKMNLALREMKYDWACGLDADDIASPQRLEVVKAAIEANPHVIAWGGYARYFNNQGRTLFMSELGPTTEAAFAEQRRKSEPVMLSHSAMTFRRDIALELGGYNAALFTCADIDLCDRLSDRGLVLAIPQVLVDYRIHDGSTTASKFNIHA
ncbi:MAG: glycosyltransferase, partial [bacterium]|nr:glycosyltransferase [bacterium]